MNSSGVFPNTLLTPWFATRIVPAVSIRNKDELTAFHDNPDLVQESKDDWWLLVTLVEACFGLALSPRPDENELDDRFEPLERWIAETKRLENVAHWEFKSTVTQLIELTRVLGIDLKKEDPVCKRTRTTLEDFGLTS